MHDIRVLNTLLHFQLFAVYFAYIYPDLEYSM